jgi:hypothetical protein
MFTPPHDGAAVAPLPATGRPAAAPAPAPPAPFAQVPASTAGHFALCLYGAILELLVHLERLGELSGTPLDAALRRYPFLDRYLDEIRRELPDGLAWTEAVRWWREQLAHRERSLPRTRLPLRDLLVEGGLDADARAAFLLVGLVEEDSRFGTLFAELSAPLAYRRPTLELIGQILGGTGAPIGTGAMTLCRGLLAAGYVEIVDERAPRAEWVLRVPPLLWDAARGEREGLVPGWCRLHGDAVASLDELLLPPALIERLARLPALASRPGAGARAQDAGSLRVLILRSLPGNDLTAIAGAVAQMLRRSLIEVDSAHAGAEDALRPLGALATLTHGLPFLSYDLAPGETVSLPRLDGYGGLVVVALGPEGGLAAQDGAATLTLEVPPPDLSLRRRLWQRSLGEGGAADMEGIAERHQLGGDYIRRAAAIARDRAALDGRAQVTPDDAREATRTLGRQLLDNLAVLLPADGDWGQLVCGPGTGGKLAELERRCRHRERLLAHLGAGFRGNANRGVRALFTGASGTGKTFAARILAAELGMDLYRVDLAAVVNKYIGETEKNLHRVLSRAEALDVVLLLDEGDALLGGRTEVRSSNDRYANLETNYLLQRLEGYQGIVVVTTNLGDNIDSAFQRRMDVVVPFLLPGAEERRRILDLHLPDAHALPAALLERVATRCQLSGGQLRNAALHASLLALDEGIPVAARHLEAAVSSEYRKARAAYPLADRHSRSRHGGVEGFINALWTH